MQKKLIKAGILSGAIVLFSACKDDSDGIGRNEQNRSITNVNDIDFGGNLPVTYVFERNNETSVSFSGQTTRLEMSKEILGYFSVDSGKSASEIEAAFNHTAGDEDFSTTELNDSSKSVKSKIAASDDLFGDDVVSGDAVKAVFSNYISKHVSEVVANHQNEASAGSAGYVATKLKTRYVSAKGLEYNQAYAKGSIGALIVDQVLNNYLGSQRLSNTEYINAHEAVTLEEGKNYTKLEHFFDEAYGYVYGDPSVDFESPIGYENDAFLFKYINKVNSDVDFSNIQDQIFKAFKIGRAALVSNDYDALNDAITVLQYQISKVVGVRAVYYLQAGKRALANDDKVSAFHDLSEGYGFVYSLQFTRNPNTDAPYLSASEVSTLIAKLEAGDGFWDLTDGIVLDEISNSISAKFDFTTAQAAE
jgi:hypothetical protein